MPKLKTKKGAAKRFRKRKSGSIKHGAAYTGHILTSKAKNRKRRLRKGGNIANKADATALKKQMPYG
ncbi:MAG TPA: 50S ribosomal protein L35 [Candidatus Omnitrophica bacterium]|nr:50S ribosomal protein L35 [Candidatus Omnitrophota bacterium]